MKIIHIKDFLKEHQIALEDISLGDFDYIGEYTAKKNRSTDSPLFKSVGCFFRPNYERGLLIYSLIKKYNLQSYLEIGFGRGYSVLCAAKALADIGASGQAVSIEPNIDENLMKMLQSTMQPDWLQKMRIMKGFSQQVLPTLTNEKFDFVYIDGDHRAPAVKSDWEGVNGMWNAFCLFDDYHLPTKKEADIECAQVIDSIILPEHQTKELVRLDRRIFLDDRGYTDSQIDYGQVLVTDHNYLKKLNEW